MVHDAIPRLGVVPTAAVLMVAKAPAVEGRVAAWVVVAEAQEHRLSGLADSLEAAATAKKAAAMEVACLVAATSVAAATVKETAMKVECPVAAASVAAATEAAELEVAAMEEAALAGTGV